MNRRQEHDKGQGPRILHAPSNIAGIAGLLSRAQRDLGYDPAVSLEAGLALQVEAHRAPVQGA